MNKWRLVNYIDVWGNVNNGWEVNNVCIEFEDLVISEDATDEDLINYLKEIEFFSTEASTYTIDVIDSGDIIEFENSGKPYKEYEGCPLCRLERVLS